MEFDGNCVVCKTACKGFRDATHMGGANKYECTQCGPYIISDEAASELQRLKLPIGLVSGTIRRMAPKPPRINIAAVQEFTQLQMPSFSERVEAYLLAVAGNAPNLNDDFASQSPPLVATAYCGSPKELSVITRYLVSETMIEPIELGSGRCVVSAKGRMRADELRNKRSSSTQGFIAMWFNDEMEQARKEGLESGIRAAGYKPHRVDDEHHIDKIDDRIIADIRRSRFLVADLTGHRHGVYYEAGFARGLDKPVFYSCREDHKDGIHFDIRQFNCIMWTDPPQLAKLLQARIEAVIGLGPEPTTIT